MSESVFKPQSLIISLLFMAVLAMAGCSEQKTAESSPAVSQEPFFSSDEYVPVASWDVTGIDLHAAHKLRGDTLYYMTGKWDSGEGGYTEASLCRRQRDGTVETLVCLDDRDAKLILYLVDETENLYYLHSIQDGANREYFWTKLSPQGQLLFETTIIPPSGRKELEAFGRLGSAFTGEMDSNGKVALANLDGDLYLFDEAGQFLAAGRTNWDEHSYSVLEYGMVNAGGEGVYVYHVDDKTISLQQIDMSKGTLAPPAEVKVDSYSTFSLELYSGYDRGIYILDENTMWQYRFPEEEPIAVLNWADGNISMGGYNIDALGMLPGGRLCLLAHRPGESASLAEITFRNRSEIPEKQTITVSVSETNMYNLTEIVSDFNRQSAEYQIELLVLEDLEDYNSLYYSLLKGEGPDIFNVNSMGIPNFAAKGIFEDLTPYFEKSDVVQKGDILPSILGTWTLNGEIVCMFPSYIIRGFLVKKGITDQGVWTPDQYLRLAEENPDSLLTADDPVFFHNEVFYNCIYADLPDYADWQTGQCHLDDPEFISMIDRIQNLNPPELMQESLTTSDGKVHTFQVAVIGQDENDFYNGLLLTKGFSLYSLVSYQKVVDFCDFAEIAGYPTNGQEPYYNIWADTPLAINSASQVKDGAWDFLEFLLSEPYQSSLDSFPVRQDSFEKYLGRTEFHRGMDIVQFTEEELDALRDLVTDLHWNNTTTGRDMLPLITEEIEAVWAGDKTPEAAAHIMQNRVSLFLSEQQ